MSDSDESLRHRLAGLERVLALMDVGLYSVSADLARVLYVNPAAAAIFGRPLEELRRNPRLGLEALAPGEAAFVGDPVAEALATGHATHVYRVRRPDGSERWVLDQTQRSDTPDGRPESLTSVLTDITHRMTVERSLRESRERLSLITDNMVDAVCHLDANMHALYASPSTERLFGLGPSGVGGHSLFECLHVDDVQGVAREIGRQVAAHADSMPFECRRHTTGGDGWIEGRLRLLYEDDGSFSGAVVGLRDITDRKQAEIALRALPEHIMAAQEEERRTLARELHDSALQELASLKLRLGDWTAARADERPAIVADVFERLDHVIGELRSLATHLRPSILDDLGLIPAIRSFVARRADERGLAAYVDAELPPERLAPDLETHCFRIVQEAVANAAAHAGARQIFVQIHRDDEAIVLAVRDDGRGFAAEDRQRAAALGHFGLSAIEERTASMGGRVEIQSREGSGTDIVARLPLRFRTRREP